MEIIKFIAEGHFEIHKRIGELSGEQIERAIRESPLHWDVYQNIYLGFEREERSSSLRFSDIIYLDKLVLRICK